ncbi:hypothetical protein [Streptomyces sp. NBC_00829]|uniref:hypothetical protein n=1 Tax=Streptomyces sp. NBC_00829 TaxID=2903679 RepID=UPI003869CA68|nr:hypothetical protein OG293_38260 [Streptomyces sp. NBC_00829]
MRMRSILAGAALGSALVLGGLAAPAQAAPAPVDSNTTADAPITPSAIVVVGWYRTLARCEADGENSAYSWWDCRWSSQRSAWGLYVDTDS